MGTGSQQITSAITFEQFSPPRDWEPAVPGLAIKVQKQRSQVEMKHPPYGPVPRRGRA